WGGGDLRGAQGESAQALGELVGAERLAGAATGKQPRGSALVAERGVTAAPGDEVEDWVGEWFGQRDGFAAEAEVHCVPGGFHMLEAEAADGGRGLGVEEGEQARDPGAGGDGVVVGQPSGRVPAGPGIHI